MKKFVITLGVFDGVHRGHQHIFQQVLQRAKVIGGKGVVYTFDPHPVKVLVPASCPPMINTLNQKRELISLYGIQRTIVQKFTKIFAHQTPEKFFQETIVQKLKACELFVGYDFTFGVHRSGTLQLLETLCRQAGIKMHVVPPYLWKEVLVSSTQIRQLLSRGDLVLANELLGHSYFIEGKVIKGRGIGEKELGIPTANLRSENDRILSSGVYITKTIFQGKVLKSVTNIGTNPTFGGDTPSIETHLFHFRKSLLGEKIRIEFHEKIRDEIRFSSVEDLRQQIKRDIEVAKRL